MSNTQNGIKNLLIIVVIGAVGYFGYTNFINSDIAVNLGLSNTKMVDCSDIEKKENDMGLMEAYYEGEKFTGMSIVNTHTMESGAILHQVMEYRDGGVLNNGSWEKYVDEDGEESNFNPHKIKESKFSSEEFMNCLLGK